MNNYFLLDMFDQTNNILKNIKEIYNFKPNYIFDIGAYKGYWTKNVQTIFDSEYFLFEPIHYKELDSYENVYHEILCDDIKQVEWYEKQNTGDSIFKENTGIYNDCKPTYKMSNTISNIFKGKNIFPELVKIDTQGSELLILKGFGDILKKTEFIILEMPFFGEYNKNSPDISSYLGYMNSIDYFPFDIIETHNLDGHIFQIDIIFKKKGNNFNNIINEINQIQNNNFLNNYNIQLSPFDRKYIVDYIKNQKKINKDYKVIDVGGSADYTNWSHDIIDFNIDINKSFNPKIKTFQININYESEWQPIIDYVNKNGKFDFCICSHTLEHISTPGVPIKIFNTIAKSGFIAFPSKYIETARFNQYMGYIHHRWIYSFKNHNLIGYPKLSFIEYNKKLARIGDAKKSFLDLSFFWKDNINLNIINNDYMGPTPEKVIEYYDNLISDDIDNIKKENSIKTNFKFIDELPHNNYENIILLSNFYELSSVISYMKKIGYIPFNIINKLKQFNNLLFIEIHFIKNIDTRRKLFQNIIKNFK